MAGTRLPPSNAQAIGYSLQVIDAPIPTRVSAHGFYKFLLLAHELTVPNNQVSRLFHT
jgi:hypothetical protein